MQTIVFKKFLKAFVSLFTLTNQTNQKPAIIVLKPSVGRMNRQSFEAVPVVIPENERKLLREKYLRNRVQV